MSKYRRIALIILVLEILFIVFANLYMAGTKMEAHGGEYKVDIYRIKGRMEKGDSLETIDLSDYKNVVSVKPYVSGEESAYEYVVETVGDKLYRFEYKGEENFGPLIIMNIGLGLMLVITVAMLIYFGRKVLTPFNGISNMPMELAKGNLTKPLEEEKSRYFGKFLWGMDMLREKLEDDRIRELELLKERETLILSLSHDIKTPLSAIDLYTKALETDLYETKEKREEALAGIDKNVAEIKRYVSEIADVSRKDFLTLTVNNGEVYLGKVMDKICEYYGKKIRLLHTEFEVEDVPNCLLYGDEDRMVEVLQNALENAIKYGDGKGISISFDEEEDCKLITVTNTGCVLGEEELPNIFDSFYRGSNSKDVGGSGLGLYICKELMHKMDGEVYAKVSSGTFSLTFVFKKL